MRVRSYLRSESAGPTAAKRLLIVAAVLTVSVPMLGGVAVAQEGDASSVRQGDECYSVDAIAGNESVEEFYDYGAPTNDTETNGTYRSDGTNDLQDPNGSVLFLYEDPEGTLSLVMIHGANNSTSAGGAASFAIEGLPEDGEWTVTDDRYNASNNYDNWSVEDGTHRIDWTWDAHRTDGGAYTGLGDDFSITVDPTFNEDASLYGEHYNGTVENWTVLSGDRENPERTPLNLSEPVTISSEPCDG